jgi:subtilisin family serine protease
MRRRPTLQHPATVLAAHPVAESRQPSLLSMAGFLAITLVIGLIVVTRGGGLEPAAAQAPAPTYAPGQIMVKWDRRTDLSTKVNLRDQVQGTRIGEVADLNVKVWRVPRGTEQAAVAKLAHNPHVAFAERDATVSTESVPNDPWWPNEWGPVRVHAAQAWDTTTGSPSVVVAVLDSGVDASQPDLQGALVAGKDIVNNDADPADDNGHGTYVAGIVGARSNNGLGVTSYCWSCSVMPVKVLGADGTGAMSNVASGITWAADHGARVVNMSLGSTSASSTLAAAVSYAQGEGVVLVASAGNYGSTTPVYPAAYDGVIGVAGTDGTDNLYSWSSYGSSVDVSAPGINMTTGRNGWYGNFSGTSSAAPVVAGLAGLVLSAAPTSSAAEVTAALTSTAVPIGSSVRYGRVDAAAAVAAVAGAAPTPSPSPSPTASPTATSTPNPSPSPTGTTSPVGSVTFSGSLNKKQTSRSFGLTVGAGSVSSSLSFGRSKSLTLSVADSAGAVGSASGASVVHLVKSLPAGAYTFTVTGSGGSDSFTLQVTYPSS